MAESRPPLLPPEEVEAAREHLQDVSAAVAALPAGLVKQRMEQAVRGVEAEIQAQLWGHLNARPRTGSQQARQPRQGAASGSAAARGATAGADAATGGESAGVDSAGGGDRGSGSSRTAQILMKAGRARVQAPSPLHAAALAVHCFLIAEGFVCTGQDDKAGAVKGFAPPVRDVLEEKLVPDRWDSDQGAVSFRYRRPDTPGAVYLLKAVTAVAEGPTTFFLASKGGDTHSAAVDLGPLSASGPRYLDNVDFFEVFFATFRREVLDAILPKKAAESNPTPSQDSTVVPAPRSEQQPRPPENPTPVPRVDEDDPLREGPPRFPGPVGVGPTPFLPGQGGDFGGDLFPSGGGAIGGGGRLPGGGGLLGPEHPLFGGDAGGGYMEPRFDPYGPPMPGQPWGPGVPGGPGRGAGPGGPGRGAGRGGMRNPPGGPDNDHLPPPGTPDNMFF